MIQPDPELEKYIETYSSREDPHLSFIKSYTYQNTTYPQMITGHLQGLLLEFISRMIHPSTILEIGTFTGYGTICLAKGLSDNGKIYTIEKNDERTDFLKESFRNAGISEKVTLLNGDALQVIPQLDISFDLVYIDGDKNEYPDYYRLLKEKTHPGSIIMVDNTLWGGKVIIPENQMDSATKAIHTLNKIVSNDPDVSVVILPLRDGLTLIRRK